MKYPEEKEAQERWEIPSDSIWGEQTQRSLYHFRIGMEKMPRELLEAFILIKRCAAQVNQEFGLLSPKKARSIQQAANRVLSEEMWNQFPLSVWQTGSGTQTNMNVNEVLANLATEIGKEKVHPNDDVNKSQSSNDTFPTAMHLATLTMLQGKLCPALENMIRTVSYKEEEYRDLLKIGRTHLQDATPLTFGQEISAWRVMLEKSLEMIQEVQFRLSEIAIGATAVGTGINAPDGFAPRMVEELSKKTNITLRESSNKFYALSSKDVFVFAHGALKALACDLMKIANDVRWLASGPRAGLGELQIPANEPGSSIMPGKVNPTQCEAVTMVACQVMGNDTAITVGASQGNFQLNVFMPMMIYNMIQSIRLLADVIASFDQHCLRGMVAKENQMTEHLHGSLMLVTALSPMIGYDKASEIAKFAYRENCTLKQAALTLQYVTEREFDQWVDPKKMIQ